MRKDEASAGAHELDWTPDQVRSLGVGALDLCCELLSTLSDRPVSSRWTAEELKAITPPIPEEPFSEEQLIAHARKLLFEFATYPGHPRFFGYICGPGTAPGAVADLLAAVLNANAGAFRLGPGAISIETHLTRWFAGEVFGLPSGAFGLLTSGGAMANFVALKAARDSCAGRSIRETGAARAEPMAIYTSSEAHVVIERAADMLGIGSNAVRKIPVDEHHRMRIDALEDALAESYAAGVKPAAVVATAGTTSTGAIDPLEAIAGVCARHGAWFHVDGAYGAVACLVDSLRPRFRGIERADSIAFDPHKWLGTPLSGGCVLVRDPEKLKDAFGMPLPAYVRQDKERSGDGIDLGLYGPEFSRGFNAFKVFFSLLAHGRRAYAASIAGNVELARYLEAEVEKRPALEKMCDGELSIACFRYGPKALRGREDLLDALNARIMNELQLDGRAFCSNAVLRGRFVLRACILNFRSRAKDVDALLNAVEDIGSRTRDFR